ncbi:hypothetical protein ACLMAJ_29515 [Nocardia sp. KC 131]|uniref:hypothetical protein n=1 Tax=Nocardia arseniciresistens TaxID=3392119 RepID=UPI00398F2365
MMLLGEVTPDARKPDVFARAVTREMAASWRASRGVVERLRDSDHPKNRRYEIQLPEFGRVTDVQLHEVAAAVELGDAGEAIRIAESIDASTVFAARRGRLMIDVARARAQRRSVARALAALAEAERLTPEQVHAHRLVHACVRDLIPIGDQPQPGLVEFTQRALASRSDQTRDMRL